MPRCQACGQEIIFVRTDKGRLMPLEAEITKQGQWRVLPDGGCERLPPDVPGRRPHFATCPEADRFRRARR